LVWLNHADNARVITTGILRQTPEKMAEIGQGVTAQLEPFSHGLQEKCTAPRFGAA